MLGLCSIDAVTAGTFCYGMMITSVTGTVCGECVRDINATDVGVMHSHVSACCDFSSFIENMHGIRELRELSQ